MAVHALIRSNAIYLVCLLAFRCSRIPLPSCRRPTNALVRVGVSRAMVIMWPNVAAFSCSSPGNAVSCNRIRPASATQRTSILLFNVWCLLMVSCKTTRYTCISACLQGKCPTCAAQWPPIQREHYSFMRPRLASRQRLTYIVPFSRPRTRKSH